MNITIHWRANQATIILNQWYAVVPRFLLLRPNYVADFMTCIKQAIAIHNYYDLTVALT